MGKRIIILLLLMLGSLEICQAQNAADKYVGFEIFLLKKFEWNENSFRENKEMREKFSEFLYLETLNQMPDSICHTYINPNKIELNEEAFLTTSDIQYYDSKEYSIALTEGGIKKISEFNRPFFVPFAVVANNKTLLIGWFWSRRGSGIPDKVYIELATWQFATAANNYKKTEIQTELVLDFVGCGKDPRNTPHFFAALTEYRE